LDFARTGYKSTSHERFYISASVLHPMADSEDIEERMEGAEDFFEGDDQWYHIDDYVEEEEEDTEKEPEEE